MRADKAVNIGDLHRLAKRRLPRIVFDFVEGGTDDEQGLARNEHSFGRYQLVPRYLVDVAKRDQSTRLFGRTYASPFGIAPTGVAALCRPGGDLILARAAKQADIPFIQSGASTAAIEAIAAVAPENAWYQLYQPRDDKVTDDLVRRAGDAGVRNLVLTVDAQGSANQERNTRNGFGLPWRMTPAGLLEALLHPAWIAGYLRHGTPAFEDWKPYAGSNADAVATANFMMGQRHASQNWRDVDRLRRLWPSNFVLKGILHPEDAIRAAASGADGIIISNHGGRRLDRAPAPIEMLPAIHAAVGDKVTLMLDSGIRRGSDIVTALCLGAKFCFVGRATLYGMTAGGLAGANRAIAILRNEIDQTMGLLGCGTVTDLGRDRVVSDGAALR